MAPLPSFNPAARIVMLKCQVGYYPSLLKTAQWLPSQLQRENQSLQWPIKLYCLPPMPLPLWTVSHSVPATLASLWFVWFFMCQVCFCLRAIALAISSFHNSLPPNTVRIHLLPPSSLYSYERLPWPRITKCPIHPGSFLAFFFSLSAFHLLTCCIFEVFTFFTVFPPSSRLRMWAPRE